MAGLWPLIWWPGHRPNGSSRAGPEGVCGWTSSSSQGHGAGLYISEPVALCWTLPRNSGSQDTACPWSWHRHSGSRITPKRLKAQANIWLPGLEPEREVVTALGHPVPLQLPKVGPRLLRWLQHAPRLEAESRRDSSQGQLSGEDMWSPGFHCTWASCCGWELQVPVAGWALSLLRGRGWWQGKRHFGNMNWGQNT